MDGWQRLFREEQETLNFLLAEEFTERSIMDQSVIRQFQDEAHQAYEHATDEQLAANAAQVAMLAEIALQLAKLNARLDGWNANGVPIENVGGH